MLKKLSHPTGLYILTFGELCERFCYYGTQMLLVLYLTKVFLFNDSASYSLYGAYAAFAFALPVIGGVLADRLIGFRHAIIAGIILLIIGNLLLATSSYAIFCLGLAISLTGIGLYKANSTTLVGLLYAEHDPRRESGYTLFYMGLNIGATLGPIVYGLIIRQFGWHIGFIFSAVILVINLICFLYKNATHFAIQTIEKNNIKLTSWLHYNLLYIGIAATCWLISLLLRHAELFSNFIIIFTVIALAYLIYGAIKQPAIYRNRIFALIIMFVFITCFFAASLQVGSTINLFIDRFVNRTLFGWEIPALIFTSLYPFFVIVMAPLLGKLWQTLAVYKREPAITGKLLIGLILASVGFCCFTGATLQYHSTSYLALIWIVAGNACLGIGELCIAPPVFAAISRLAPANLRGTIMGSVFLFVAFGGYLSGIIARLQPRMDTLAATDVTAFRSIFIDIIGLTLLVTVILIIIIPLIKKLMAINA